MINQVFVRHDILVGTAVSVPEAAFSCIFPQFKEPKNTSIIQLRRKKEVRFKKFVFKTKLQWNPDFSNPRFFELPPDTRTKVISLPQSNTVILPPFLAIELTDFSNQFSFPLEPSKNRDFSILVPK